MELRKITQDDKKLLFDWANDKEVRNNAIRSSNIKWEDHDKWFDRIISSNHTIVYILEVNTIPVGQIRFDKEQNHYLIDYSVDKNQRGKGFGKLLVELGHALLEKEIGSPCTLMAHVKLENPASSRVFEKLGFIKIKEYALNQVNYYCWALTNMKEIYLIVSEKKWNDSLLNNIQLEFPDKCFYHISDKKYFNVKLLSELKPVKIFFPHWSYYIPEDIYMNYECIVFHMTDLPFGRGGSPLQNLIVRGIQNTKLSSLRVVKDIDAGPIYTKKDLSLGGTAEEIFIRTNTLIEESIIHIISSCVSPVAQNGEIVLFERRKPDDSNLKEIDNLNKMFDIIRMLDAEGYPKAFIETEFFKLEFSRASLKSDKTILSDVRIIKK